MNNVMIMGLENAGKILKRERERARAREGGQ